MSLPARVRMVEVGPRDGLQNESAPVSTEAKVELIDRLALAGLRSIEAGSFVSPKWVPQMADTGEVLARINRIEGVRYMVLTPNLKGLELALQHGASEVAIFAAATETFSQKNINCSIAESLERFAPVAELALRRGVPVRGYVSCAIACPYEGPVAPEQVAKVAARLLALGCYEVSLGDTIGVGTLGKVNQLIDAVLTKLSLGEVAVHFHDTYGQALANTYAAVARGIAVVDSSIAGLGGCPYARGATGNVASEDILYMLQGLGIETGVDLVKLCAAGDFISAIVGRKNLSRVANALRAAESTERGRGAAE